MRDVNNEVVLIFALNTCMEMKDELELIQDYCVEAGWSGKIKPVQGKWDGQEEQSYAICCPDDWAVDDILGLAFEYKQESVLYLDPQEVDGRRKAYLIYLDPVQDIQEPAGYFTPCTQSQAYKESGYTFDANTGQHYILKGE